MVMSAESNTLSVLVSLLSACPRRHQAIGTVSRVFCLPGFGISNGILMSSEATARTELRYDDLASFANWSTSRTFSWGQNRLQRHARLR